MITTYHVTPCPPAEIDRNFMPITHFGDPRIGLVQAYRNILDSEILANRNNPNFIPYAKIYVYKVNLKNDFPVQVEDHGAPNAMALLNCFRSRNSLRPNGKNLITDQEFYDFRDKDFDLRATRDLGERATLPGRKRAAEIIRSHNCDCPFCRTITCKETS